MDRKLITPSRASPGSRVRVLTCGLPRSGTTSLIKAFDKLGIGPTYHGDTLLALPHLSWPWLKAWDAKYGGSSKFGRTEWDKILEGFEATTDLPSAFFAEELAQVYPEAKIVINYRDFDSWFKSCCNTIFLPFPYETLAKYFVPQVWGLLSLLQKYDDVFGYAAALQSPDCEDRMRQMHKDYYDNMRQVLPKDRTIEWNFKDGWEPLCKHLDISVPKEPFPHENSTKAYVNEGIYLERLTVKFAWRNATVLLLGLLVVISAYRGFSS